MKRFITLAIAILPFIAFAEGNGKHDKTENVAINISTGKDGKIEITGLKAKDLKEIERSVNKALKNITIKVNDGKEKHELHFKAEIKTD